MMLHDGTGEHAGVGLRWWLLCTGMRSGAWVGWLVAVQSGDPLPVSQVRTYVWQHVTSMQTLNAQPVCLRLTCEGAGLAACAVVVHALQLQLVEALWHNEVLHGILTTCCSTDELLQAALGGDIGQTGGLGLLGCRWETVGSRAKRQLLCLSTVLLWCWSLRPTTMLAAIKRQRWCKTYSLDWRRLLTGDISTTLGMRSTTIF